MKQCKEMDEKERRSILEGGIMLQSRQAVRLSKKNESATNSNKRVIKIQSKNNCCFV